MSSEGNGESKTQEVLTPVVVKDKQKKATSIAGKVASKTRVKDGKGRPNKTDALLDSPITINFIEYLIKQKASDGEIAQKVNVPYRSFLRWKAKHKDLWRRVSAQMELTLAQRAEIGLEKRVSGHWVERAEYDKKGNFTGTKFQYYPPSDTAIQYVLNNRDPANWKARVEHNHALEELPFAVNFVLDDSSPSGQQQKKISSGKAVVDDFGNEVIISGDDNQGNG